MSVLKTLSQFRNEYIYVALFLFLLILTLHIWWLCILLCMYLSFLWKGRRHLFKLVLIIGLLYLFRFSLVKDVHLYPDQEYQITVTQVDEYPNSSILMVKTNRVKVQVFYQGDHSFSVGERYKVHLSKRVDKSSSIPYTFDQENYRKGLGIRGVYQLEDFTYVDKTLHVNQIIEALDGYILQTNPKSYGYIKTMVLADNDDLKEEALDNIRLLGISHLFAVSGLHIGFLVLMLRKGLMFFIDKDRWVDLSLAVFLLVYLVITSFTPSVVRASLMVVFLLINKYGKLKLDSLDIVSIVFLFLLFVHPFYYLQVGFQLSFLMTFFLLLGQPLLKGKNGLVSAFMLSSFALLSTLPFTLSFQQSVNLLTILYNVLYSFVVMLYLLPMSYLCLVLPGLDGFFHQGILVFERSLDLFVLLDAFVLNFVMNKTIYYVIYYFLLVLVFGKLEEKKRLRKALLSFGLFLLFLLNQQYFVFFSSVHFVDVYGDATLIQSPFDRCNILVDTGDDDDYDQLITYLHNQHVKRLDYLIISHHHDDHAGELEEVLDAFHVVHYVDKNTIDKYEKLLTCGNVQMYFYEMSKGHANENNNSLVMSLFIASDHYLFSGDMEAMMEEEFLSRYFVESLDKLKVAHHGSVTSSTEEWLDYLRPKEAFMMVSLKNTHGHPSPAVVKRYEERQIDLYRTDQLGTIEIRYFWGKEWKKTSK